MKVRAERRNAYASERKVTRSNDADWLIMSSCEKENYEENYRIMRISVTDEQTGL